MLQSAFKISTSLQYGMLTGIQRVAKENIFSGLNNLDVCTVVDKSYHQYFGFTEEETKKTLEYYDLKLNEDVKEMYDRYHFSDLDIYNPWSIINYVKNKKIVPYWLNTSINQMIRHVMKQIDQGFNHEYERLIKQGYLDTEVIMETSFYEEPSLSSLWGLFVNAGYLTIDKILKQEENYYRITIPNKEVRNEFISLTEYYCNMENTSLSKMFRALIQCQKDDFINEYSKLLLIPSYHDLITENSYHMFLLGASLLLMNHYKIISNPEEGTERCDLILESLHNQTSFVIEFKYLKSVKENVNRELEELANEAVQQIIDQQYAFSLNRPIVYIGLAHYHKQVKMKWLEQGYM